MDWSALARRLMGATGPEVRLMRPADLDEVLRIIRLHDSDDYHAARQAFSRARFDLPHEVTAHFVLIEPDERRPVGVSGYFGGDDPEAGGVYWLGWTYVNPFFRGRGYGGHLMEFVFAALREVGARKLFLTTSSLDKYSGAVRFYERHGFAEEGRLLDYYQDGEHQIVMGCHLSGAPTRRRRERTRREPPRQEPPRREPPRQEPPRDEDDGVVFEF